MCVTAKDDPITNFKYVPIDDIKRNPNLIMAVTKRGGHSDFWYYNKYSENPRTRYERFIPYLAIKYFDEVDAFLKQSESNNS